jgi:hypothetical protein
MKIFFPNKKALNKIVIKMQIKKSIKIGLLKFGIHISFWRKFYGRSDLFNTYTFNNIHFYVQLHSFMLVKI